jgi:ABC-type molybdate transport system substrate-binding protein
MNRWLAFLLLATLLATLTDCAPAEKTPLSVFAAGSLIQPFDELEKAFEAAYPQIDILNEYHGSIQVIRHVPTSTRRSTWWPPRTTR